MNQADRLIQVMESMLEVKIELVELRAENKYLKKLTEVQEERITFLLNKEKSDGKV